jgi:hypothetical protein
MTRNGPAPTRVLAEPTGVPLDQRATPQIAASYADTVNLTRRCLLVADGFILALLLSHLAVEYLTAYRDWIVGWRHSPSSQ